MATTEEKLAKSLTAGSTRLIEFLPYLLQDLWEIGSSPEVMTELLRRHVARPGALRVLDLACGKGAVSVALARSLGCEVKGVDLLADFVAYARDKAREHGVAGRCTFEVADANAAVERERGWDVVILGAAGDILGTYEETLAKLARTVRPGGYLLIDDAFRREPEAAVRIPHDYLTREQWLALVARQGLVFLEAVEAADDELRDLNDANTRAIARRAAELSAILPDLKALFDDYVKRQEGESDDLADAVVGVTLLLRKAPRES
jgi:ubiquinone/menaquinone biosynthesis C-methylase UbiE